MRRADRQNTLAAGVVALALVVPLTWVGLAEPAPASPGTIDAHDAVQAVLDAPVRDSSVLDPALASTTTLSLSSPVAVFGGAVTARVAVTGGTPTGSVKVLLDGTPVAPVPLAADGTAQVRLPEDVATGRHTVTAVYGGDPAADPPVLGSASAEAVVTVTRTLPSVRTDSTDWTVRRGDPKDVHVQVAGIAGVTPAGTVDVWVNGSRKGSATVDARGAAVVTLPKGTKSALVVVTYAGDPTYLPWVAAPHLLVVR